MRIALLVIGVVFLSAWNSRSEAGPTFAEELRVPAVAGMDYRSAVGEHPTSLALARAIDARLIVRESRRGEPIHVQHCRASDGGCRARIATLSRLITEASNRAGVDPFLTAGIALRESGLNPLAVSPVGARGVVQLNPKYRGKSVPFVYNTAYREKCSRRPGACQREVLDAGLALYKWAVGRCGGDVQKGLAWYNSGRCDSQNGYASSVLRERRRLLRLAKAADPGLQAVFTH
ncbi:MAG: lytic transglycosylase domain-containing protein [Deltaproteobacteria bacterium]|nr:lytic transglycosylase domain-containing protein [Deltaproteobacteria bacterium]NND28530.1 transglycosylase SLT domain-containing protein [Myxococcales bacterium]MBT8463056.1 lytic transglycosylase domain-containing protein [Deltaproteobacteria bacterium]MBT8483669.1 lytic transglycosylase domain-containing protein [Deltaproteobacteria bacterium]NNK08600.1 transglycosylase SLT domain-containing protein [Myxococcales bacterium]